MTIDRDTYFFLGCLRGSEQLTQDGWVLVHFLGCLRGSERLCLPPTCIWLFLGCLRGSELKDY